jgi:hypothetical protein
MSDVSTKTSSVTAMEPDWTLARALLGGTRAMRTAGKEMLPQWPNEDQKAYDCRLATAVLFPAYKRTIETLTGKPFSKPVAIGEDVPAKIKGWLEDADLQGRNLDTFAADVMETALGCGLAGILVDFPDASNVERTASGIVTQAAEKAAGLRPYLIHIYPWQLLGWRARRVSGAWQLTQLRLMECVEEEAGDFGMVEVGQVRVLTPGAWATYRKNAKEEWVEYESGVTTLNFIPYVPVYGQRIGFMMGKPPLVELAHMNVKHWQSQSDQDTILHVARVPILAVVGIDDANWQMTIGAAAAVKLPVGADMKYVEHTGAAIEAGKVSLDDLKEEMRQAGAELLVIEPGKVTATQVASENAVGMCALQRIAKGVEDALDQALQIMAEWIREAQGGHVTLFDDYAAKTLAEASMQIVAGLNISDETKFEEAQRRGMISQERKWADERDRLDAQGPALGTVTLPANGNA